MLLAGARVVPWLLLRIARTRSRELFILVALTLALGTALGAAALFGVSLALGAFLAGVVVSESPVSHQVGADLLPFREAFAVLFFVSVGMLVDPAYLLANAGGARADGPHRPGQGADRARCSASCCGSPLRTALVVAAGLSQIGEFSFILGQAGVALGMLHPDQYSLILAGALLSITLNPLMFRLVGPVERALGRRRRAPWRAERHGSPSTGPRRRRGSCRHRGLRPRRPPHRRGAGAARRAAPGGGVRRRPGRRTARRACPRSSATRPTRRS